MATRPVLSATVVLTTRAVRATATGMPPSSITSAPVLPELDELLNEPQRQAVAHKDGPLMVFAGAGSGKTRVITFRIANLLALHRVPPYRILAVTFTNKAASEMRSRLERLVGAEVTRDLWVGTFHSTCARLLRRHHEAVGLARDFLIYDDADQRALMARVLKALDIDDKRFPPKALLGTIHSYKQQGIGPADAPRDNPFEVVTARAYEAFEKHLLACNAVDFDDLILHAVRLAEDKESSAGDDIRSRFRYVLVDEFQDANPIQYRLVKALASQHHNLCVVGDDDQSIYRWRGADVRIIRGFERDFAGATTVKLEENYRSSSNIVSAALGVIQPSRERVPKELFTSNPPGEPVRVVAARDERDEAAFVVLTVKQALEHGVEPREIAIFYRIHAQSRVLEEALRSENVPYQIVGGTKFFERAEIKDLLSYLRVLASPQSDVDLVRIINVPARGIGQATIERIVATATRKQTSLFEVLMRHLDACGLGSAPAKRVLSFRALLEHLRERAIELGPRDLAEHVIESTGYAAALQRENTPEADARLENLREMLGSLQDYEDEAEASGEPPSLSGYLERVALIADVDQMQDGGRVSMMTVHAAKGLEFEVVLVTGVEEDLFPYRSTSTMLDPGELEEERRLGYVAFTRARKFLFVTNAGIRTIFGQTRYCRPSRFLADMPANVVEQTLSPGLSTNRMRLDVSAELSTQRSRAPLLGMDRPRRPPEEPGRYMERDVVDPEPQDDVPLQRGTLVSHERFGEGKVESVEATTSPPVVVVFFPGWGKKRIVSTFLRPA